MAEGLYPRKRILECAKVSDWEDFDGFDGNDLDGYDEEEEEKWD